MVDEININSTITRNEELLSGEIDHEIVIMNLDSGSYHVINKTGQRIWELLEKPMTVEEICSTISEEYEVDTQICLDEVLKFLADLQSRQIVQVS
jgi:hypothetical protein